jgi:hypothetical protein
VWLRNKTASNIIKVIVGTAAGLFMLFAAFFGYVVIATDLAEKHARHFCATVPVGAGPQDVLHAAVLAHAAPDLTINLDNAIITIGWHGAFLDRWYCNLDLYEKKVVGKKVNFVD